MFEGLSSFTDLLKNASDTADYIKYWRKFKGEKVDIRTVTISKEFSEDNHVIMTHTIRGKIAAVNGLPPGLILEGVEERLEERKVSSYRPSSSISGTPTEVSDVAMSPRRIEEKFVSFSSIEELELAEMNESAETNLIDLNEDNDGPA